MLIIAAIVSITLLGLAYLAVRSVWRRTAGKPFIRAISVAATLLVSLIIITIGNKVTKELLVSASNNAVFNK